MTATWDTARRLAVAGRPVLPVEPGGKAPLTRHGVKDATTDLEVIRGWLDRCPNMNLAVATGAPGPTVLDVDDLDAARDTIAGIPAAAPAVATPRGRHFYFEGQARGTVGLGYGELRGQGSYVVCPPSVGAGGRLYTWLVEPAGRLPAVPAFIAASRSTAGTGPHVAPARPLAQGDGRHPYLKDFAVRMLRGGVTDEPRLLAHLRLEFELSCEPLPPPAPGALEALARWAARSTLAERERSAVAFDEWASSRGATR